MYTAIQNKFSEALAKKSLSFTPSTEVRKTLESGVNVIYTTATSLTQKPKTETPKSKDNGEESSPWLPPSEDLLVDKNEEYSVVLNKFAIAKYHFLLVTSKYQSQSFPLTEEDWEAAYKLLRTVNKESGKRHIGFFNCGPQSGASITHKHIQFLTLPDNFRPFVDSTPKVQTEGAATADSRIPFAHYIVGLDSNASAEDIVLRYSEALGRVLTRISLANPGLNRPEINYNLVFTEEWIMATPRKAESTADGIAINALGTIGLLLAKSDKQQAELEARSFELFEKELGFPYEEVTEYAPDFTGYTHY